MCSQCRRAVTRIMVPIADIELTLEACSPCELRRWSRDGETLTQADVLGMLREWLRRNRPVRRTSRPAAAGG